MLRSRNLPATTAAALAAAVALAGCSSTAPAAVKAVGLISITYLQKQGDQQYFRDEAAGAKARAAELGIDLRLVDVGSDNEKAVAEVQAAVKRKADGVIVVVPDPAVGPQVVKIAQDAGIPLLASDDPICANQTDPAVCARQKLVPRVGFSGAQMGGAVGKRAAEEYLKAGWKASDTRIIAAGQQDVSVCRERLDAAQLAFLSATSSVHTLNVRTDNTVAGAQKAVASMIAVEPGPVKHWLVWGCNDENVQGAVTAIRNAGADVPNVIGIGLGAYLACKEWSAPAASGMRAALFINGKAVGALAVQTMYDQLRNGRSFPAEAFAGTTMVDPASWQAAGVSCV